MNFFQRLKRYLFGVLIGLLLSVFFFKDKLGVLTSWLPENAVKTRIYDSYHKALPSTTCLLDCHDMTWDSLLLMLPEADVQFDKSQVRLEPKEYQLTLEEPEMTMRFAVADSSVYLLDIRKADGPDCNCSTN